MSEDRHQIPHFSEGELVRVTDGPFTNCTGVVEEVHHDGAKLRVTVSVNGRRIPAEFNYTQVEQL